MDYNTGSMDTIVCSAVYNHNSQIFCGHSWKALRAFLYHRNFINITKTTYNLIYTKGGGDKIKLKPVVQNIYKIYKIEKKNPEKKEINVEP